MSPFRMFAIYLMIGYLVTFYMINFYRGHELSETKTKDLYLAAIGPFIWPLQIIKHIIDLIKLHR